jgi:hypothetical protein
MLKKNRGECKPFLKTNVGRKASYFLRIKFEWRLLGIARNRTENR